MQRATGPRGGVESEAGLDVAERVQSLMEEYQRRNEGGDGGEGSALKQQVVEGMAPVVEAIARRYAGTRDAAGGHEPVEDLISEGYVGLLAAIDQYRPDRGARFSTYATHRIQGQIRHYLRDRGSRRLIRAPSWLQELATRLQKEEAKLLAELGRPATTAELAERLNLQEAAVEELRARGSGPAVLSLTDEGGEDEEEGRVDLSKLRNQHYVSWQLPVEDHIFLDGLMVRLKELERNVIQLFFFQEFSQSEIARSLNISCNYVGYLLNNGLRRLRKLIEADELRDAHLRFNYAPRRMAGDPSVVDPVTGLYTGAYFRSRMAEELARACRYGRRLAVVVVRVPLPVPAETGGSEGKTGGQGDGETEGRKERRRDGAGKARRSPRLPDSASPRLRAAPATGGREQLLRELGVALRECLRKADIPACLGEGTFAAALPHTGEGAAVAAERITTLLSQVAGCPARSGIALYPADGRETGPLLELAVARAEEGSGGEPQGKGGMPAHCASLAVAQPG